MTASWNDPPGYCHTQRAPLALLLVCVGLVFVAIGWATGQREVLAAAVSIGCVLAVVGLAFRHLTVRDEGDHLAIRFGPLPLFRRRIPYEEIRDVARDRSLIVEGWGIHCSPRGGWVWNLWGRDCIRVERHEGTPIRIGTDDPDGLLAFLQQRITSRRM